MESERPGAAPSHLPGSPGSICTARWSGSGTGGIHPRPLAEELAEAESEAREPATNRLGFASPARRDSRSPTIPGSGPAMRSRRCCTGSSTCRSAAGETDTRGTADGQGHSGPGDARGLRDHRATAELPPRAEYGAQPRLQAALGAGGLEAPRPPPARADAPRHHLAAPAARAGPVRPGARRRRLSRTASGPGAWAGFRSSRRARAPPGAAATARLLDRHPEPRTGQGEAEQASASVQLRARVAVGRDRDPGPGVEDRATRARAGGSRESIAGGGGDGFAAGEAPSAHPVEVGCSSRPRAPRSSAANATPLGRAGFRARAARGQRRFFLEHWP